MSLENFNMGSDGEKKVSEFWEKNKIDEKILNKNNESKKTFSFFDGPPTANNSMGVHHGWGRTYKDVYLRFRRMQGYNVRAQPGFDCQGLWVEVEVEKELGMKTKKEIEKLGLAKFSNTCRERVDKYSKIWVELSKKLGMVMDWDNAYYTMSDDNNELVWTFIKTCHNKKWLQRGQRVSPWCPRCETSLSSHEVAGEYADRTHDSVYIKYPLQGKEKEFLFVWTTTPWTLPSNVACAVHPDLTYVRVEQKGEILYLAKDLLSSLDGEYKVLSELRGADMEGAVYNNAFSNIPQQKGVTPRVIVSDVVSNEDGTGIVHIAPGHGDVDYILGKENALPVLSPVNDDATYNESAGWLKKKSVSQGNELVKEHFKKSGLLYKVKKITHRYPTCWRCHADLIYKTNDGWYISSDEIKPDLIKEAKKIVWYPTMLRGRMLAWLEGLKDWNISRKRYWGNPLPIWMCKNNHYEVIGSRAELKRKAIRGMDKLKELHRPWIDKVVLKCPKCPEEMHRIKEVGDCWLDAGVMPFSTLKYLSDKKYWKKWFPADFITEMMEQVRLWFYSMLFISVTLEGKAPYKTVLGHGMVLDEKGESMHKSKGNAIWGEDALNKIGGDVMRWMYLDASPSMPMRFGYNIAKEQQNNLNVLWNTAQFFKTYSELNEFKPSGRRSNDFESIWIISKLNSTIRRVGDELNSLHPHAAKKILEDFFLNELSRWYVKLIRGKVKKESDYKNKQEVLNTLYEVIFEVTKMTAPLIPFTSEALYQALFRQFEKEESVHLISWARYKDEDIDLSIEKEMDDVKRIVEKVLALRDESNLRIRWPIQAVYTTTSIPEDAKEIIKEMCNAIEVHIVKEKPKRVFGSDNVFIDPSESRELKELGMLREITRTIQAFRKQNKLSVGIDETIFYEGSDEIKKMAEKEQENIFKLTNTNLVAGNADKEFEIKVRDKTFKLRLSLKR